MNRGSGLSQYNIVLSWRERIGYSLGEFGQNLLMSMSMTFALLYQTDIALIPLAVIGVINLFFPWFDLLTDLLYAWVIDNPRIIVPGKWKNGGWFRPWVFLFAPLWSISFVMGFAVPQDISLTARIIWLIIWRVLYSIFVDYVNGPHGALLCRMTRRRRERNLISMLNGAFVMLTVIIVQSGVPFINRMFEDKWIGYFAAALIFAMAQWFFSWIAMISSKERVVPLHVRSADNPFTFREMWAIIRKLPYLYGWIGSAIIRQIAEGLMNSLMVFYFIYYLAIDESKMGLAAMVSGAVIIPAVFLSPLISNRIGNRNTYLSGLVLAMISSFLRFFVPPGMTGFWMLAMLGVIGGFGLGLFLGTSASIGADINDYAEYRTGERVEGLISGVSIFLKKILGGLSSALPAFLLGMIGFSQGADSQSDQVTFGIRAASSIGTGLLYLISIIIFIFAFPLTSAKMEAVNSELSARRNKSKRI